MNKSIATAAALLAATIGAAPAQAAVTILFENTAAGVEISVSGSLDTSYFTRTESGNGGGSMLLFPSKGWLTIANGAYDEYTFDYSWHAFGKSGPAGSSNAKGVFGMTSSNGVAIIALPKNYVSGSQFSATGLFKRRSIAGLGIDATNFEETLPGGQTLSFQFQTAAVPEPGQWALLLTGVGLAGAALRRRALRIAVAR